MPVEFERKYVLGDLDPRIFTSKHWVKKRIRQGYLGGGARVRESTIGNKENFIFTYKKGINNETIEIETHISEEDFNKLWSIAKSKLEKTRYSEIDQKLNLWEVDFFGDENDPYFIMAECEIYTGDTEPYRYPKELDSKVVYHVEQGDKRFTSKALTKSKKTATLYKSLQE